MESVNQPIIDRLPAGPGRFLCGPLSFRPQRHFGTFPRQKAEGRKEVPPCGHRKDNSPCGSWRFSPPPRRPGRWGSASPRFQLRKQTLMGPRLPSSTQAAWPSLRSFPPAAPTLRVPCPWAHSCREPCFPGPAGFSPWGRWREGGPGGGERTESLSSLSAVEGSPPRLPQLLGSRNATPSSAVISRCLIVPICGFLAAPCGIWDLSCPARNQTCAPCSGSVES